MPILSRGAVNDLTNDRQNFAKLVDVSPCDNVFLEHCLALEFQHRGLIERVYPVLLGDAISVDGEEGFEHYFNTGCHPDLQGYVVVKSVREKIDFHLDRLCLGTPLVSDFSVRSVEKEVLSNQGKVADGAMKPLIVAITQDIKEMMVGLYQHTKNVNKLTDEFKMLRSQKLGNSERFRSQSSISESAFGTPRSKLSASSRSNMSDNHMVALVTRSLDEHKVDDHSGVTEVHALLEQDSERNSDDTHSVNRITSRASSVGVDDGFGVAADDTEEAKSSRSVISPQSIEYKIVPNE